MNMQRIEEETDLDAFDPEEGMIFEMNV